LFLLVGVYANFSDVSIVYVGSTKTFRCHANYSQNINWGFEPVSLTTVHKTFSVKDNVASKFAGRYSVNNYLHGDAVLTVTNIQHCDAGFLECNVITSDGNLQTWKFSLITVGKRVRFLFICDNPIHGMAR